MYRRQIYSFLWLPILILSWHAISIIQTSLETKQSKFRMFLNLSSSTINEQNRSFHSMRDQILKNEKNELTSRLGQINTIFFQSRRIKYESNDLDESYRDYQPRKKSSKDLDNDADNKVDASDFGILPEIFVVPKVIDSPSLSPSIAPSITFAPSLSPSSVPSISFNPTAQSSVVPTIKSSIRPSYIPTDQPITNPSASPSITLSLHPSVTQSPSLNPTFAWGIPGAGIGDINSFEGKSTNSDSSLRHKKLRTIFLPLFLFFLIFIGVAFIVLRQFCDLSCDDRTLKSLYRFGRTSEEKSEENSSEDNSSIEDSQYTDEYGKQIGFDKYDEYTGGCPTVSVSELGESTQKAGGKSFYV